MIILVVRVQKLDKLLSSLLDIHGLTLQLHTGLLAQLLGSLEKLLDTHRLLVVDLAQMRRSHVVEHGLNAVGDEVVGASQDEVKCFQCFLNRLAVFVDIGRDPSQ